MSNCSKDRCLRILNSETHCSTTYAISIRQASVLLTASFRFHLAMDPLAVRLTIPPAGDVEDLHLQVNGPCRAHNKNRHPGTKCLGGDYGLTTSVNFPSMRRAIVCPLWDGWDCWPASTSWQKSYASLFPSSDNQSCRRDPTGGDSLRAHRRSRR